MARLQGIDTSYFQGSVDGRQVAQSGKSFWFIKATEGTKYRDPQFEHSWNQASVNGVSRIAYHFFYDNLDAIDQVRLLHDQVRVNGRFRTGDAAMIDVEEVSITGAGETVNKLREIVLATWYEIDKPVIIYTNPDTWLSMLHDPTDDVLAQCPLFVADYGGTIPAFANWPHGASFWQYTDKGHCPGVNTEVDLDVFFGTRQQLNKILYTVPHVG